MCRGFHDLSSRLTARSPRRALLSFFFNIVHLLMAFMFFFSIFFGRILLVARYLLLSGLNRFGIGALKCAKQEATNGFKWIGVLQVVSWSYLSGWNFYLFI